MVGRPCPVVCCSKAMIDPQCIAIVHMLKGSGIIDQLGPKDFLYVIIGANRSALVQALAHTLVVSSQ